MKLGSNPMTFGEHGGPSAPMEHGPAGKKHPPPHVNDFGKMIRNDINRDNRNRGQHDPESGYVVPTAKAVAKKIKKHKP